MRYHYKRPDMYRPVFGKTMVCDHPIYSSCTLYKIGKRGMAVIQQRFDPVSKSTTWTSIDPWVVNDIYLQTRFKSAFDEIAAEPKNSIYPTVTIRHLMWILRMKPLPKEPWETVFDRAQI